MGLFAAIKFCIVNFRNFRDRAGRGEFWNWLLFIVLLAIVPSFADLIYGMFTFTGPYILLNFLPTAAVFTRRLHDTGRSGWWGLIAFSGIGVLLLAFWCVKKGALGNNLYGAALEDIPSHSMPSTGSTGSI